MEYAWNENIIYNSLEKEKENLLGLKFDVRMIQYFLPKFYEFQYLTHLRAIFQGPINPLFPRFPNTFVTRDPARYAQNFPPDWFQLARANSF